CLPYISVEDPNAEFQRIRDFIDCKRCIELPECLIHLKPGQTQDASRSIDLLLQNGSNRTGRWPVSSSLNMDQFRTCARKKLKINKRQSRRVYDILRLFFANRSDESVIEFYRKALVLRTEKMYQRFRPDGLHRLGIVPSAPIEQPSPFLRASDEQFQSQIFQEVDELMQDYSYIVKKLDKAVSSGRIKID
ncbi:unnamed protein product, partial [Protopolystoma xenopodis]